MSDRVSQLNNLKTSRLDAFTDGIFAIVATLLVITIEVPEITPRDSSEKLLASLLENWPHYLSFILSFIIISIYWFIHHFIFRIIVYLDRVTLSLNLLFLMTVAFIPFPTDLMSEYRHHYISIVAFAAINVLAGMLLAAIWIYCAYTNKYVIEDVSEKHKKKITQAVILAPSLVLVSLALSFILPTLSILLLLVAPFLYVGVAWIHVEQA